MARRNDLLTSKEPKKDQLSWRQEMLKRLRNGALVLAIATSGVCLYGGSAQADPTPTPTPVAIEVLTPRAAFTDHASMQIRLKAVGHGTDVIKVSDPSNVVTTRVTVQPGAQIPWHTHPGPVVVTIAQGELTYTSSEGCTSQRYPAGTAFIDPGHGHIHTAVNTGPTEAVFTAMFFEAPAGTAPVSIPADAPAGCKVPTS
jgi:quercetin dioxygenase-like cupin family protein